MKLLAFATILLGACLPAQDSKPAKGEKTASAPTSRPVEMVMLGRKVSLTIPDGWTETQAPSTFALDGWKPAKGWQNPKIAGFAIHVYGAEGKDLTPAALAKKWLDAAGSAKTELMVTVTGKNRQVKGLDVEVEMSDNGAVSFYWLRVLAASKDKVIIVLAEASPLVYEKLETIVLAAGPILDSVLDPAKKDPWRRDPEVVITRGTLVTRLTTPAGWKYTRLAPEGSLIWMGPENGQEVILAFPQKSMFSFRVEGAPKFVIPPEQIYKLLISAEEMIASKLGKLISKTALTGHDQATEIVSTQGSNPGVGSALWMRRRVFLDAGTVISLVAKYPVKDVESVPPDPAQKVISAVMGSITFEVVKGANDK